MITLTREGRIRLRRHAWLAAGSIVATIALGAVLHRGWRDRFSTATAYVGLALLAITLALGPINVLRNRPNPVSFNLRRDFGIWAAIVGVSHAVVGLTVHLRGRMYLYFIPEPGHRSLAGLRVDAFGAANDTGLVAAIILIVLAAISNDLSLRSLGTDRWRMLQRGAYVVLAGTIIHAVLYQLIEKQRIPLVILLTGIAGFVIVMQLRGYRRQRATKAGL